MGVGMEEPVSHQLLQITCGTDLSNLTWINPGSKQCRPVIDFDARQIIQTEHLASAQLPDHSGNTNAGVIKKLLTETGGMLGLKAKIQFSQQHTPALLSNRHPVAATTPLGMALHHRRHLLHHFQIKPEHRLQAWTLNLEHHLATAAQTGAMHLSQRGRSQRRLIEINDLGTTSTQL